MKNSHAAASITFLRASLLALAAAAVAASCTLSVGGGIRGSGDVTSETRSVSGFSVVAVTNQGDLDVEIGGDEKLVVTAEANLLPHITSQVRDGKLILGTARGVSLRPTKPIRYILTVRALEGLETSSSGDIKADRLEAERFSLRSSSSGDIDVGELSANELTASLSSSGDVSITGGQIDFLDLDLSSSGDYDAEEVGCRQASVRITSSGDASIRVEERLEATLTSSGNLYYRGDAQVDARTTSAGKVRRMD